MCNHIFLCRVHANNGLATYSLKWNKHNNKQCKRMSKGKGLLGKAIEFVSQEELEIKFVSLTIF